MRNFEPFWNRACASCRRTVQRAACVPASALSTATRFVEYRLTDGHSVGAAPGNHWGSISSCSYIKPQLVRFGTTFSERCLSSCSYIKPQLASRGRRPRGGCLSSCSYIKPQPATGFYGVGRVVYHLVPTSNHNSTLLPIFAVALFIILFLHQTTTYGSASTSLGKLFIILFLHQTTTWGALALGETCCLSSCSYIKPQPCIAYYIERYVVYHLVPTSNHNLSIAILMSTTVVYHLVPTSNHNESARAIFSHELFIILFLHQTTTAALARCFVTCCLSSCSYIKPQPTTNGQKATRSCLSSCSYIKPQPPRYARNMVVVVYHLVPTSNHNILHRLRAPTDVVYHLVPTSNHNL